jgi:hypothetical protein
MTEEGEPLPAGELFTLALDGANEPKEIAARLSELPEFADLLHGKVLILFLMRMESKVKGQRAIIGEMALPRFQGALGPVGSWLLEKVCGETPDFIMLLDAQFWAQADVATRTALVHHELLHATIKVDKDGEQRFTDEGRPVWDIKAHDLEEFDATVRRYGAWKADITSFVRAAKEGGAA